MGPRGGGNSDSEKVLKTGLKTHFSAMGHQKMDSAWKVGARVGPLWSCMPPKDQNGPQGGGVIPILKNC